VARTLIGTSGVPCRRQFRTSVGCQFLRLHRSQPRVDGTNESAVAGVHGDCIPMELDSRPAAVDPVVGSQLFERPKVLI
jgi:hypothetical protein